MQGAIRITIRQLFDFYSPSLWPRCRNRCYVSVSLTQGILPSSSNLFAHKWDGYGFAHQGICPWSSFVNADTTNTLSPTTFPTRGVARLIHSADPAPKRTALKSVIRRFRASKFWRITSY